MKTFAAGVIKYRWVIIVFVLVVTCFLGFQIPKVRVNSDVISSLPSDDPDAVLLKRIGEQFGGNRIGMVILECEHVFKPEVLSHVRQITDSIKDMEGISSVTSLTNIMDIKSTEDGIDIGRLIDENNLPQTTAEMEQLKKKVLSNELYKGSIVSDDGTATIIVFTLFDDADIQTVAAAVKAKSEAFHFPEKVYYAGSPMLVTSISRLIRADLTLLFPIAILVIAVVLLIGFRSLRGIIMPLLVCVISIVWVIGIMGLLGFEMTMVSNNIPIVLLAVGSAYAIHVLNRIDTMKEPTMNNKVISALIGVTIPVILAALTTIAGFLSFIFGSYLNMIRDFGLFTALGTFFALLLSLIFVPAIVSVFARDIRQKEIIEQESKKSYLNSYFLNPLQKNIVRFPKQIILFWIIMTIAGIGGIFMIERNVDIRNYFREGNPSRTAEDMMTKKFGGTKPVFVHFKGDIQNPDVLNTMLKMEEYMKKSPDIVTTQSIAGLIADINAAFGDERKIPDEKEKIEQLWFMIDGNESLRKFVSEDLTEAVIISKFISQDNRAKKEFKAYMQKFIDANSTPDCVIQVTGMPFIDITMDRSLINSQIGSLAIAIVFVIFIVGLLLRSAISGLLSAIPIVSAIIMLFGIMGFTGIPLNIATVLVASIVVGIGIDYSIHVITHFNHSHKNGVDIETALKNTIEVVGKAIIINVVSVSAGFLVLLFSEMVPLQYFGLLISLSMLGSGLGALILLPSILMLKNKKLNN